ncbi:MAG: hypothetical protein ACOYOA_07490 [Saprospiraceae bacterium]
MNLPNGATNLLKLESAMSIMKAAAQPQRVTIINLLMENGALTVQDMMKLMKQQNTELLDRHLEVLMKIRFLECQQQNNALSYQIVPSKIGAIQLFMSTLD